METICIALNSLLPVTYGLATASYFHLFRTGGGSFRPSTRTLLLVSISIHLLYLILRGIAEDHIPLTTQGEAITFFTLATVLIYLYLEVRMKTQVMGVFVVTIVFAFQLFASFQYQPFAPMQPILRSGWFALHATTSTASFAGFAIAALLSLLYLLLYREINSRKPGYIFQRIPSLEALDEMAYKSVWIAFVLLTIGLFTGGVWAHGAWEEAWTSDPKILSAIIVWLIYGGYLFVRTTRGWRGKRVAVFALVGFATLLFTFILVEKLFHTVHRII